MKKYINLVWLVIAICAHMMAYGICIAMIAFTITYEVSDISMLLLICSTYITLCDVVEYANKGRINITLPFDKKGLPDAGL